MHTELMEISLQSLLLILNRCELSFDFYLLFRSRLNLSIVFVYLLIKLLEVFKCQTLLFLPVRQIHFCYLAGKNMQID